MKQEKIGQAQGHNRWGAYLCISCLVIDHASSRGRGIVCVFAFLDAYYTSHITRERSNRSIFQLLIFYCLTFAPAAGNFQSSYFGIILWPTPSQNIETMMNARTICTHQSRRTRAGVERHSAHLINLLSAGKTE